MNDQYSKIKQKIKIKTVLFEIADQYQNSFGEYPSYNKLISIVNQIRHQANERNVRLPFLQENIILSDVSIKKIVNLLCEGGPSSTFVEIIWKTALEKAAIDQAGKAAAEGVGKAAAEGLEKAVVEKAAVEGAGKAAVKGVETQVVDKVTGKALGKKSLGDTKVSKKDWADENIETVSFGRGKEWEASHTAPGPSATDLRGRITNELKRRRAQKIAAAVATAIQPGPHIPGTQMIGKVPEVMVASSDKLVAQQIEKASRAKLDRFLNALEIDQAAKNAPLKEFDSAAMTPNPEGLRAFQTDRIPSRTPQGRNADGVAADLKYQNELTLKRTQDAKDKAALAAREELRKEYSWLEGNPPQGPGWGTGNWPVTVKAAEPVTVKAAEPVVVKATEKEVIDQSPQLVKKQDIKPQNIDSVLKAIITNGIDKKVESNLKDEEIQKINFPLPPKIKEPPIKGKRKTPPPPPPVPPPRVPPLTLKKSSISSVPSQSVLDNTKDEFAPGERWGALVASGEIQTNPMTGQRMSTGTDYVRSLQESHSGKLNTKSAIQSRVKKQQYKITVTENSKKLEIFASSIRGIRRAVYGKKNYRVFDSKGSDITNYFKRLMATKKST